MNVLDLSKYAKYKGVNLLGTGDLQHPKYLEELKAKLKPTNEGLYEYDGTYYVLQTEVANIYSHNGKCRKIHHLILVPDFDAADELQKELLKWGRIDYDGRPIFGMPSQELVKLVMGISDKCEVIPAHIWTPWFGLLGSMGGYNSIKECYDNELKHIHALETGLSSDPPMNWRCSWLDQFSLISNSDSHSPWPWRMGRECNVFDIKPSYNELINSIRTRQNFLMTIEVDPAYGKYHYNGHRACNFSCGPIESKKLNNICPNCKRPLTIGVEHRVEELADRPVGYKPSKAVPFKDLIPLSEIISSFISKGVNTKAVWGIYNKWIECFGNEFNIMLDVPEAELINFDPLIGGAIIKVRNQAVDMKPGFDGEYGVPLFNQTTQTNSKAVIERSQKDLKSFF
jgi:uncharacterized protein (TIGR00375 family)